MSNYSSSGLMRLFGYSTTKFDMEVTGPDGEKGKLADVIAKKNANMATVTEEIAALTARVSTPPEAMEAATMGMAVLLNLPPPSPEFGFAIKEGVILSPGKYNLAKTGGEKVPIFGFSKILKKYKPVDDTPMVVTSMLVSPVSALAVETGGGDPDPATACVKQTKPKKTLKVRYLLTPTDEAKAAFEAAVGEGIAGVLVPFENITIDPKVASEIIYNKLLGEMGELTAAEKALIAAGFADEPEPLDYAVADEIRKWFSPEENPVVKSFNEASGKGLAGVINQLDMDWSNGNTITWDTSRGRKAPQMCKVTLGFSPIHDLPLGLDADGAMSNPAYMVGNVIQQMYGGPVSPYSKTLAPAEPPTLEQIAEQEAAALKASCKEVEAEPDTDAGMKS